MFGNMFGDLEKKQQEMLEKTGQIVVEAESGGVKVTVNGNKEILNIVITDPSVLA